MLRARPREKKSHFERFIVLGDADPKHVEERLGNALVSHEVISRLQSDEGDSKPHSNGHQAINPYGKDSDNLQNRSGFSKH